MRAKIIIFPNDDGFNVLVWGKWMGRPMRVRRFANRTEMLAVLEVLNLLTPQEAKELEEFEFLTHCPLYCAEVDEDSLISHGFGNAD